MRSTAKGKSCAGPGCSRLASLGFLQSNQFPD
jgi:hypothetical protein